MPEVTLDSPARRNPTLQPVIAGLVTALVGYTSSFAVVLTGLQAVGASPSQAASGLLALTLTFAVVAIGLAWFTKRPITTAWSTPGAALLAGAGGMNFGWNEAVGAFLLTGVLIAATGAIPWLGRLVAAIPVHLAQAMLAGVLLQLCLAPFMALSTIPLYVTPVIVVWLLFLKLNPRWAVPVAMAVALGIAGFTLATSPGDSVHGVSLLPHLEFAIPAFTLRAFTGIALPLFVVTMASQNVPGVAVLKGFGYDVPWRSSMLATGIGTSVGALFGGHAINLAAISAALAAGDEAGPDRSRRWIAAVSSGGFYIILGLASAAITALAAASPAGLLEAAAGLALLATLGSAASSALAEPRTRLSALITFLVAASGLSIAGIGGAFWALVAGLTIGALLERGRRR
ncbi:benzoate/H(+) symporter BenE family transporter [Paeniglutamicibacter cryotolerans]|uniref:Benzoate membrane transport protein n=1 Tax=Paeniglutamicibacter cryotolerans TaxID=670079 RepID=A0A839QXN6_9MICC|nr:benzoate/H(+) symporter BenE family transporter [Paeniglutamicibacter cryotolerans]MBB2996731.1 benzoate membrane transport protein [Paeniglutamicibacter cryotolerans]